jgi:putative FmdB family regulatory protein
MPKYEYDCSRCGSFSDFRPLAEYELPVPCPNCGTESPRAVLCFPAISTRAAAATRADASQFSATPGHGAGCRCCGGKNFKIPRKEWMKKLL